MTEGAALRALAHLPLHEKARLPMVGSIPTLSAKPYALLHLTAALLRHSATHSANGLMVMAPDRAPKARAAGIVQRLMKDSK